MSPAVPKILIHCTRIKTKIKEAISNRLQLDLQRWLFEKYGLRVASELTITEANSAIDELNSTPSNNGADQ